MGKNWIHRRENLTRIKRVTDCALMTWIKAWSCTRAVNRIRSCRFCWVLLCAVARQVTGKLSVTAIALRNATAFCKPCCMAPVSACKGFSVWKYIWYLAQQSAYNVPAWGCGMGSRRSGTPFWRANKKAPLAERSGCYQRRSMTAPISILASYDYFLLGTL